MRVLAMALLVNSHDLERHLQIFGTNDLPRLAASWSSHLSLLPPLYPNTAYCVPTYVIESADSGVDRRADFNQVLFVAKLFLQ